MLSSKAASSQVTPQAAWVPSQCCTSHAVSGLEQLRQFLVRKSHPLREWKNLYISITDTFSFKPLQSPAVISLVAPNSFSRYHGANVLQQNYPTGFCSSRSWGSWGFCGSQVTEVRGVIKSSLHPRLRVTKGDSSPFPHKHKRMHACSSKNWFLWCKLFCFLVLPYSTWIASP